MQFLACCRGLRKNVPSTSGYLSKTSICSSHRIHWTLDLPCEASVDRIKQRVSSLPWFPSSSICNKCVKFRKMRVDLHLKVPDKPSTVQHTLCQGESINVTRCRASQKKLRFRGSLVENDGRIKYLVIGAKTLFCIYGDILFVRICLELVMLPNVDNCSENKTRIYDFFMF